MEENIPAKLRKEPLLEAVWEIRFKSAKNSVAELLPGLIFNALPNKYPNIIRLPAADIPDLIITQEPNLKYIPKIRLVGGSKAIQIGEYMISVSYGYPYPGWKEFSKEIQTLITILRNTGLIEQMERFSLKYVNIIEFEQLPNLRCLKLELKIGGQDFDTKPVQLRTEIKKGNLVHIIQIVSPAEATIVGKAGNIKGVLLDIDSIKLMKENESYDYITTHLDRVHLSSKKMFFGLLTGETIENLGPEY